MAAPRRKRCPHCGFLETIKWGRQGGHQRYKCKNCDTCFTSRRKDVSSANRFIWFKWWILRKQTVAEISQMSGHSSRQLSRWFDSYLRSYPEWEIKKSEKDINLLIDGTWFPNNLCLVLYRDETAKTTLFYRITDDERACEIVEDLNTIRAIGVKIKSITTDGSPAIIRAVEQACPDVVRQRCVAHIQRECLNWITRFPHSDAAKELRRLAGRICTVRSATDRAEWVAAFDAWCIKHKEYVCRKSGPFVSGVEWKEHRMVCKAYTQLRRALPNMFNFVDHADMPRTTSALEAFFGQLKENISLHRGLSRRHSEEYVRWYLHFRHQMHLGNSQLTKYSV